MYTRVLNVAVAGSTVRSTGCEKNASNESAGMTGPDGRPKNWEGKLLV